MPKMQISLSQFAALLHGKPLESWQQKLLNEYEAGTAVTYSGKAEPTDEQVDAEIDAKVAAKEKADEQAKQKAELEKSVAKVEAAAKNEGKSTAGTATAAADTQTTAGAADIATAGAQTSYDYAKDVAPVLTKVAQKSRDSLVALLAKFGAKKGNELKADDYAAVLAAANELLAG